MITASEIEITQVDITDKGVQVFLRAWDSSGEQIGFGPDGTVDIERIRMNYTPTLVLDPNGDIEETILADPDGGTKVVKYSWNPELAMIEDVKDTLRVKKEMFDSSKIIPGKVGNTTTVYNSEVAPATLYEDGVYTNTGTWATIQAATSDTFDVSPTASYVFSRYRTTDSSIYRDVHTFDTSDLGTDTISSATFAVYALDDVRDNHTNTTKDVGLVEFVPADYGAITNGEYDQVGDSVDNPTEGAPRVLIADVATAGDNTYSGSTWTLDATGRGWIDKTGYTGLGLRTSWDMTDTQPSPTNTSGSGFVYNFATAGSNKPKLTVEHAAGGSLIKSVNSVLRANIKSWNGVILE